MIRLKTPTQFRPIESPSVNEEQIFSLLESIVSDLSGLIKKGVSLTQNANADSQRIFIQSGISFQINPKVTNLLGAVLVSVDPGVNVSSYKVETSGNNAIITVTLQNQASGFVTFMFLGE
jgi:hypothetical protein